jgi:hypothetical protein
MVFLHCKRISMLHMECDEHVTSVFPEHGGCLIHSHRNERTYTWSAAGWETVDRNELFGTEIWTLRKQDGAWQQSWVSSGSSIFAADHATWREDALGITMNCPVLRTAKLMPR